MGDRQDTPQTQNDLRKAISAELGTLGLLVIPSKQAGRMAQIRESCNRLTVLWYKLGQTLPETERPPF